MWSVIWHGDWVSMPVARGQKLLSCSHLVKYLIVDVVSGSLVGHAFHQINGRMLMTAGGSLCQCKICAIVLLVFNNIILQTGVI